MNAIKKTVIWILQKLAQLTVARYRPGVIGVTGSVGKTSTKLAIASVLQGERSVRVSKGNLNTAVGIMLTVLGDWPEEELWLVSKDCPPGEKIFARIRFYARVIAKGVMHLIAKPKGGYPEILILEYGVDRPGDMKHLLEIVHPNISVLTAIGDIPVHVEFFSGPDDLAREKARLIDYLPAAGFAVLNADDGAVMNLRNRTRAHLMTFGFGRDAEISIANFENKSENGHPVGSAFKLQYAGSTVPVQLRGVFGKAQAYASAAAAAIGLIFGVNLVKIAEALGNYRSAGGRTQLVPGIKSSFVIDDSYNASPLSMHAALDTLRHLPAKRRIAVLGDMLEIGEYALQAHEQVGRIAAGVVDILVTVGPRAKFIAEAAKKKGMTKRNLTSFDDVDEALPFVQELLRKGDLTLVKASHAMHLEKIVEGLKAF